MQTFWVLQVVGSNPAAPTISRSGRICTAQTKDRRQLVTDYTDAERDVIDACRHAGHRSNAAAY